MPSHELEKARQRDRELAEQWDKAEREYEQVMQDADQQMPSQPSSPSKETIASRSYFLYRDGKVFGPFPVSKLKTLRSSKKLKTTDQISDGITGPWFELSEVHKRIIDEGEALH